MSWRISRTTWFGGRAISGTYIISIMTSVVALARAAIEERQDDRGEFNEWLGNQRPAERSNHMRGGVVTLDKIQRFVMGWSYSNLKRLFDVGKKAGKSSIRG
jgi:hypothetical protein